MKRGLLGAVLAVVVSGGLPASAAESGGLIAFSDSREDFELVLENGDGSSERRLVTSLDGELDPSLSPDGGWVAFERSSAQAIDIEIVRTDGTGRRILAGGPGLDIDPAWSPDGSRIAWVTVHEGKGEVFVANADGSGTRRLTTIGPDSGPAWSPDGTRIAFSRGGVIHAIPADGSEPPRRLVDSGPTAMFAPSWSPDGRAVAMESHSRSIKNPEQIFVAAIQPDGTGRPVALHVGVDPQWSRNGEILFLCADHLWAVRPDGRNARRLRPMRTNYMPWTEPPAGWSFAAGKYVYGQNIGSRSQVYTMLPNGREVRRLSEAAASAPTFSPDGKRLAVYERIGTAIALSVIEGQRFRRLATFKTNRQLSNPAWSPDGRRIAYEGRHGLFIVTLTGRRLGRVPGTTPRDASPSWSPNGRTIAFTRHGRRMNQADIRAVNLATRKIRLLRRHAENPAWSPNGRRIAYTNAWLPPYNHDVWVMRSDGSRPRRLTRHRESDLNPVWSPDGRRIAFVHGGLSFGDEPWRFRLLVMPVGGGRPRPIGTFLGEEPRVSWRR